jgi:hypothetical protein
VIASSCENAGCIRFEFLGIIVGPTVRFRPVVDFGGRELMAVVLQMLERVDGCRPMAQFHRPLGRMQSLWRLLAQVTKTSATRVNPGRQVTHRGFDYRVFQYRVHSWQARPCGSMASLA